MKDAGCTLIDTNTPVAHPAKAVTMSFSETVVSDPLLKENEIMKGLTATNGLSDKQILLDNEDEEDEEEVNNTGDNVFADDQVTIETDTEKILNSARINNIIAMESLRRQSDYAGMKISPKKEPRLISQILTPSPFPHHNEIATSDRYRSALNRIQSSPLSDVEAWQAILNECTSLYRTQILPALEEERKSSLILMSQGITMPRDVDLESKLDWVESCHGHLLRYFPYCCNYYVSVIEVLLARSALPFETLVGGSDSEVCKGLGIDKTLSTHTGMTVHADMTKASSERQSRCEENIDRLFQIALGVEMDGSPVINDTINSDDYGKQAHKNLNESDISENGNSKTRTSIPLLGGICTSSVDLWLLYIRKCSRDARRASLRIHGTSNESNGVTSSPITSAGEEFIRETITQAYETALKYGASFVNNNHMVWKQYLTFMKSWVVASPVTAVTTLLPNGQPAPNAPPAVAFDHSLVATQKQHLRNIYQRLICLPMAGLNILWLEYEQFEKSQSEQLSSALIAENMPKFQHARQVYLERQKVYNLHELRVGRLATPPVDLEFLRGSPSNMYGEDGVIVEPSNEEAAIRKDNKKAIFSDSIESRALYITASNKNEYETKMKEEGMVLAKWKRRCGYERTNPERLLPAELTLRVRQAYKDAICAFMRHVEIWHEWSSWELYNSGGGINGAIHADIDKRLLGAVPKMKKRNVQFAIAVLEMGQRHIPDCTLLAYAHAQIMENQISLASSRSLKRAGGQGNGKASIRVMTEFCNRAGNTLGYVLLQRLVRKHLGVKDARAIFAKARRSLRVRKEDTVIDGVNGIEGLPIDQSHGSNTISLSKGDQSMNSSSLALSPVESSLGFGETRKVVMHQNMFQSTLISESHSQIQPITSIKASPINSKVPTKQEKGFITWHLYAAHATMEQRMNNSSHIASRVFELGLKKHRSFLSTPSYVLQYASLLSELNDKENLRALLTRAIAACEEQRIAEGMDDVAVSSGGNSSRVISTREAQRPLWNTMLKFEATVSSGNNGVTAVQAIEARRRKSLYGANNEDVAGGNSIEEDDVAIGLHKSNLSEILIRTDGYDVSSRIANGLERLVDSLETIGILEGGETTLTPSTIVAISSGAVWKDDGAAGLSDASYRRRIRFQQEIQALNALSAARGGGVTSGITGIASVGGPGTTSDKFLSAKERYMTQNAAHNAALALQSSPEWLKGLLSLLPSTSRNHRVSKAPPHLIEMALTMIRDGTLPADRPKDTITNDSELVSVAANDSPSQAKRKRTLNNGNYSSDEENGGAYVGGYGTQFRARQRARMIGTSTSPEDTINGVGVGVVTSDSGTIQ